MSRARDPDCNVHRLPRRALGGAGGSTSGVAKDQGALGRFLAITLGVVTAIGGYLSRHGRVGVDAGAGRDLRLRTTTTNASAAPLTIRRSAHSPTASSASSTAASHHTPYDESIAWAYTLTAAA